jgi:hypothetical protein
MECVKNGAGMLKEILKFAGLIVLIIVLAGIHVETKDFAYHNEIISAINGFLLAIIYTLSGKIK